MLKAIASAVLFRRVLHTCVHNLFFQSLAKIKFAAAIIAFVCSMHAGNEAFAQWSYAPTATAIINSNLTLDNNITVSSGSFTFNANVTDATGGTAYSLLMTGGTFIANSNNATITFEGASTIDNATFTIKSGCTVIMGALNVKNNSHILIEAGGTLIVNGNMTDANNGSGNTTVKGYVQIYGNYSSTVGGVEVDGTTGVFQTTGSITTSGGSTVFGSTNDCASGPCSGASLSCGYTNQISPSSQTICSGQSVTSISSITNAPSSSVSYQWQWSTSAGSGFTNLTVNATSSTLNPYNTDASIATKLSNSESVYFRVQLVVGTCPVTPVNYSPSSGIIFKTETPPVVTLNQTAFCGVASGTVSIPYTVVSGTVTKYSITWSPLGGNLTNVNNQSTSGSPLSYTLASNVVAGNYTGTVYFTDANACTPGSKTFVLSIGAGAPVLSSVAAASICETGIAQTTSLSYSATNSPSFYSIAWNTTATGAGFTAVTDASLGGSPVTLNVPANAVSGATYTGTLSVKNGCNTSSGTSFNVTVNPKPNITSTLTPGATCSGSAVGYVPLCSVPSATFSWSRSAVAGIDGGPSSGTQTIDEVLINSTSSVVAVPYTVTALASGCSGSAQVSISVVPQLTLIWNGSVSSDWSTAANWSCAEVPTSSKQVIIPSGMPNQPVLTGTGYCGNVRIAGSASLTLTDGAVIYVAGDFDNEGTFNSNKGTVEFNGGSAQTINGQGAAFYQINVNKSGGSLSVGTGYDLPLKHLLNITSTTAVNTNGNLLLMSLDNTTENDASIGAIPEGASVNGEVRIQRMIKAAGVTNRYVSPMVSGINLAQLNDDFTVKSGSVRYYNEKALGALANGYTNWPITGTMEVGRGYLFYMYDNVDVLWDVKGTITSGSFSFPNVFSLTKTTTFTAANSFSNDGWNLVGNPYPSAISWKSDQWVRTNIGGVISVPDLNVSNTYPNYYHYYNYIDQTGDLVDGIIAMGQAFWVHADAASPVLTVMEGAKTSAANGKFYRAQTAKNKSEVLTLSISKAGSTGGDKAFFKINAEALDGHDKFDGVKFKNPSLNIFLIDRNSDHLVMHTLPQLGAEEKIPFGIQAGEEGEYLLSLNEQENSSVAGLYFVDLYEGVTMPVKEVSNYSFYVSERDRSINDRFYLSRKKENVTGESRITVYPNPFEGNLNVYVSGSGDIEGEIWDAKGKSIISFQGNGHQLINLSDVPSGMYVVRIRTEDGVVSKKIFRK
jgi:hypothetical protein